MNNYCVYIHNFKIKIGDNVKINNDDNKKGLVLDIIDENKFKILDSTSGKTIYLPLFMLTKFNIALKQEKHLVGWAHPFEYVRHYFVRGV
jgi:hypothetical protein